MNFFAIDGNCPDDLIRLEHRDRHDCADACNFYCGYRQYFAIAIGAAFPQIGNVHRLACFNDVGQCAIRARMKEDSTNLLHILRREWAIKSGYCGNHHTIVVSACAHDTPALRPLPLYVS